MPPGSQTLSRNQYAPSLTGQLPYAVGGAEANSDLKRQHLLAAAFIKQILHGL
jgi:hypothetical protein